jgi:hypothetical protein
VLARHIGGKRAWIVIDRDRVALMQIFERNQDIIAGVNL